MPRKKGATSISKPKAYYVQVGTPHSMRAPVGYVAEKAARDAIINHLTTARTWAESRWRDGYQEIIDTIQDVPNWTFLAAPGRAREIPYDGPYGLTMRIAWWREDL